MARFRPNVAILLLDRDDRLLICERSKVKGAWQFPQGGVDEGESMRKALFREVEEEIGLPKSSYEVLEWRDGYRYIYPPKVKNRKKGRFDGQEQTYYLCRLNKGAPPINIDQKPREFGAYRWVKPSEFDLEWVPDFKKDVYRQVLNDFFEMQV